MTQELKEEKRIYNLDLEYLEKMFKEYKAKTGASQTAVFAALGKTSSYRQTIEKSGISQSNLYKLCVILGLNPTSKKLFVGGEPNYQKPKQKTEHELAINELKKAVMCLQNENDRLKERIDFIEKELGVAKPKEVSIVKKIV